MKQCFIAVLIVLMLAGCTGASRELGRAAELRNRIENGNGVSFDAEITADYGDEVHTFKMHCETDREGSVAFSVAEPKTIAGISGSVSSEGGKLTFEDTILAFETMTDGQLSPVIAPWLFINSLRSGYLAACGKVDEGLRIMINDSYRGDTLHLDIWTDAGDLPVRGEILWQGRRILTIEITNFAFL